MYTSLIVCLLPDGISQAIQLSKAEKLYIANATNFPQGHCDGYSLSDYLHEIASLAGITEFDRILAHDGTNISQDSQVKISAQDNITVMDILTLPAQGLGGKFDSIPRNVYRHDARKVLDWILR